MRRALAMFSISTLAMVVSATGISGCGGGAAVPDGGGGIVGTGGGGTGGGGGITATGGTPMVNCGDVNQPIDPTAIIDDMETPDFQAVRAAGRAGAWWAGGDLASTNASITPMGNAPAELIPGGRCGSKYAVHVTGQGFTMWSVLSVSMGWGSVDGGAEQLLPNDNSYRTGVTFWARIGDTSTDKVRFAISDKYSRPEGGFCVDGGAPEINCYDTHGVDLTQLGTDWKQYRIPFGGLTQRNFGLPRQRLDSSSIYTIEFNFNPNAVFDLWVDDIAFY
jgi:hypothetical protein